MTSAPTIAFDYRPSRQVGVLAGAVSACALAAIALSGLGALPAALLAGAVLVLTVGGLRRYHAPPYRRIAWQSDGWWLVDSGGREHAARLAGHHRLGPLVALDFRATGRSRFHPLLAPDNLDADTRRRLVLLLARGAVARAT